MKIDARASDNALVSIPDGFIKGSLSDGEIKKTVSFLALVWPQGGYTYDYLHWLYRENPVGFAEVYNVWDKGQIIAHYAAIPIMAKLFGCTEKGLLSLNTAVHPLHRGKGYFKSLANLTFEDAHYNGANFVIGVANSNSTLLFRRQLRFQFVTPLTVKIGLGNVKRSLKHDIQFDYMRTWDRPTLNWRLKRPNAKYYSIEKSGFNSILGHTGRYGIWASMLDITSDGIVVSKQKIFRWNPFNLWIGLDESCDWGRSNYVNIPDRLKPSPLNLVFKDLSGMGRLLNSNKILFSLLDFDAY